jgi:hypothetical protein
MTDLIDGVMLIPRQVSALIDSIFFEEIANLVPRLKEVIITDMVVITRREFGLTTMDSNVSNITCLSRWCAPEGDLQS